MECRSVVSFLITASFAMKGDGFTPSARTLGSKEARHGIAVAARNAGARIFGTVTGVRRADAD